VEALGPFHNRSAEWELYQPLVGDSMLELGNKKNGEFTYKAFFEARGYRHVSVDLNGQDGALALDLRHPISLGTFDLVTNIGTSEHVDEQLPVWRNIVASCHVGSVLICTTPKPGHWHWHGFWHPHAEFYTELAALNGFEIERLYESGQSPRVMNFCRMVRVHEGEFVMPHQRCMYHNAEALR
jgi:hypothetical protein